jgi:hypothetical protein
MDHLRAMIVRDDRRRGDGETARRLDALAAIQEAGLASGETVLASGRAHHRRAA